MALSTIYQFYLSILTKTKVVTAQLLQNAFWRDLYLAVNACFNVHFLG